MTGLTTDPDTVQTRESLLNRLKGDESRGWQEFYRVYGKIVHDFALHAGLTETEADEVVQDTMVAISRHIGEFRYDRSVCRFKTWLLNQASWRIKDQMKKRAWQEKHIQVTSAPQHDSTARTSELERIPDAAIPDLAALFEADWQQNLLRVAQESLKARFSLKHLQIFDLHAMQGWSAAEVAKSLGVSIALVYVTKHRVATALKKEVVRLQKENRAIER